MGDSKTWDVDYILESQTERHTGTTTVHAATRGDAMTKAQSRVASDHPGFVVTIRNARERYH